MKIGNRSATPDKPDTGDRSPFDRAATAALTVGAVARLTRLAGADTITAGLRHRLLFNRAQRAAAAQQRPTPAPARPKAAKARSTAHDLVTCPWCLGLWLATAGAAAAHLAGHTRVFRIAAGALTTSYVVGLLAEHAEPDED